MTLRKKSFGKILIFYLSGLLILRCATSNVPTLGQEPECTSSIEGFFHCPHIWGFSRPAIVPKNGGNMEYIEGKILSIDDKGVTFDARPRGLYDPKPKYYPFKKIETLIGNDGEILAGKMPKRMSRVFSIQLFLQLTTNEENEPIRLVLKPDKQFGFCIPPGTYVIKRILFIDNDDNVDEGVDFPALFVNVEANHTNYLGDLFLDTHKKELNNPINIAYKIVSRPQGAFAAGMMGGMIGGAIHGAAIASQGIIGEHKLFITSSENFEPKGKNPPKTNLLQVQTEQK